MLKFASITALAIAGLTFPAHGDALSDFYRDKRINLVVGYSSGGGYDQYARVFSRHFGSHLPGNPVVVVQNMPGAASRKAANWLAVTAPKDGTAIATLGQNTALDQALGEANVQFDVRRFNWLGNIAEVNNTLTVWHTTGVRTIADATKNPMTIGASGASSPSVIYPQVSNNVLGTKFKIIAGYPGSNDINLAMERGEVDGRGSSSWSSWTATKPDWVRDHKIVVLFQVGARPDPELAGIPLWSDLAGNNEDREVLQALSSSITIGYSMIAPPDVPADRVSALRLAFMETVKDSEFLAEAAKQRMDVRPIPGDQVAEVVSRTADMSATVVAKIKRAMENKDVKER
jgi:tripartite-type tricarboxylate transporter receptor subunit TctC